MCIQNRVVALIYRLCAVSLILVALYLITGFSSGRPSLTMFVYYTIQSAIWGLLLLAAAAIRTARDWHSQGAGGCSALSPGLVGAVTLAVTITMLVYHFMLAPRMFAMQSDYRPFTPRDILIHYATPLSVILDWLLFVPKGRYRWWNPLAWLALPLGYLAFALVRAELGGPLPGGGRYPYFFIDLDALGWGRLLVNVAALSVAFAMLGYVSYGLDWALGRLAPMRARPPEARPGTGETH